MLYKYIGSKFKVNNVTILSDGDIITINEEKENDTIKGTSIINNMTGKEIPGDIYFKVVKHLKPLDTDASDIDDEEFKNVDKVDHPSHYIWLKDKCGVEVIDITRHMDFDLGNAIKYILRCGHKSEEGYTDKEKQIEDLKKAIWYVEDEIKLLENEN